MTTQAFNLSQFANYLNSSGQVSAAGIQSGVVVSSGTIMLFYQASAPTGWTQITSFNDYALRLVSGSGGSTGGTSAFSTVFTNQTPSVSVSVSVGGSIGATTLSTGQMPSHNHNMTFYNDGNCTNDARPYSRYGWSGSPFPVGSEYQGGNESHSHSFSGSGSGSGSASTITLNVRYANIIICSKN